MPNDYDRIFKENIEPIILPLLHRIMDPFPQALEEIPDDIQTTIERKPDFLKLATGVDETDKYLLHIEFQTTDEPDMARRMLEYCGLLHRKYSVPVVQYVLYVGEKPPNMPFDIEFPDWKYRYRMVRLFELDAAQFIRSDKPEEVVLGILGDFKNLSVEEQIHILLRRIEALSPSKLALGKYVKQLEVLSKLRNLQIEVSKQISTMAFKYDLETDIRFRQGMLRGRKQGKKEGLKEGIEKGIEKGLAKGLEKKALETIRNILQSPAFSSGVLSLQQIADIVAVPLAFVKKVYAEIQKGPDEK